MADKKKKKKNDGNIADGPWMRDMKRKAARAKSKRKATSKKKDK